MKKSALLLLFIACAIVNAHAQFSFEGGLVMSNLGIKSNDTKVPTTFKSGSTIGIVGGIPLNDDRHFFLELGAFYQSGGAKITSKPEWEYLLTSITIPINIEYKWGSKCTKRFFMGAGPYIRRNISGSAYKFARSGILIAEYTDLEIGTDIKKLDMGLGINLGYLGKKHWYTRISYELGLMNNLPNGNEKNHLRQSAATLTVGYLFRGCKVQTWTFKNRSRSANHWRGIKKGRWSTHPILHRKNGPSAY